MPKLPPDRTTRRRVETRQRLLAAAAEVFSRQGFGRSTVEQICSDAGYTRGAFYSNFDSLDELFLAMWEERSRLEYEQLAAATAAAAQESTSSLDEAVARVVAATPVDERWYRITAEFTAHALRNPDLRRVVADREEKIIAVITPILEELLEKFGRRVTDPSALGHAVVAVHDGTMTQCLVEDDTAAAYRRRSELFATITRQYSEDVSA